MDFRVDQVILGNKPATDDTALGYAFTYYQISSFVDAWFEFIFPLIIIAVFVSILARVYKTRKPIDCLILVVLLFLGGMFVMLLIPTYVKMDEEFRKSDVSDPFEYAYSSNETKQQTHQSLFFIANVHVILIIVCIFLLFLLKESNK